MELTIKKSSFHQLVLWASRSLVPKQCVLTFSHHPMVPLISHHDVSQKKKMTTYSDRTSAVALQDHFINEARVDVVGRVINVLEKATGLPVRMAQEGERKYFAGLLRVVDNTYCSDTRRLRSTCTTPTKPANPACYFQNGVTGIDRTAESGEIGHIAAQITGNTLLATVLGGETIIHDRQWQGAADDAAFRKPLPSYAYSPTGLQGSLFKVITPVKGDLTFSNSGIFTRSSRVMER